MIRVMVIGDPFAPASDYENVAAALDALHRESLISEIIVGEKAGIEEMVRRWAHLWSIPRKIIETNFSRHGLLCSYMRTEEMFERMPNLLLVFKGGGTSDAISRARRRRIPVRIFTREHSACAGR